MSGPARSLRMRGTGGYRDTAETLLERPGDCAIVERERPRSLVMACPDGCGDTLVVNLDPRAGKAWRLDMRGGTVTLVPSVWREGGCGSHFIAWRGRILWDERFAAGNVEPDYDSALEGRMLPAMEHDRPTAASEIADAIDEIVWDVDRALRRLAKTGALRLFERDGSALFVRPGPGPASGRVD